MGCFITILIPTYNREEKLIRTLEHLNKQTDSDFSVYISDNASDYSVKEAVGKIKDKLCYKVDIHRNIVNIGADANIANLFLFGESDWIWPIADDDLVHPNAVYKIKTYCEKYSDAAWIEFPVFDREKCMPHDDLEFTRLPDYISFLEGIYAKTDVWGNLVYLANKVYSRKKINDILPTFFQYNYTKISTSVIVLKALDMKRLGVVVNDSIIDHDPSEGVRWNALKVCLGVRTYIDIDFDLDWKTKKRLYHIVSPNGGLIKFALKQYMSNNLTIEYPGIGFDVVYYDLYKKFLPFFKKPKYLVLVAITKYPLLYRAARKLVLK